MLALYSETSAEEIARTHHRAKPHHESIVPMEISALGTLVVRALASEDPPKADLGNQVGLCCSAPDYLLLNTATY